MKDWKLWGLDEQGWWFVLFIIFIVSFVVIPWLFYYRKPKENTERRLEKRPVCLFSAEKSPNRDGKPLMYDENFENGKMCGVTVKKF